MPRNKPDDVTKLIKMANGRISDALPEIIEKLIELGRGVEAVGHQRGNGKPYVYSLPPNFKALEYLCNRVLGKPVDENTLGEGNAITEITVRYENDWRSIPDSTPNEGK
jgi:hypothetical protein